MAADHEDGAVYEWLIFRGADQTGTYLGTRDGQVMSYKFNQDDLHYIQLNVSLPNGCTASYGEPLQVSNSSSPMCSDSLLFGVVTALNFELTPLQDGTVLLDWEMQNEVNGMIYEVEHSSGGEDFETIGTVSGTLATEYDFLDEAPMFGVNYYRLKYIFPNGTIALSDIRQVVLRFNDEQSVRMFPNPTPDITTMRLLDPMDEDVMLELINGQGVILERILLPAGETEAEFDLSMYQSGHYFIYFQQNSSRSLLSRVLKVTD